MGKKCSLPVALTRTCTKELLSKVEYVKRVGKKVKAFPGPLSWRRANIPARKKKKTANQTALANQNQSQARTCFQPPNEIKLGFHKIIPGY